MKRLLRRLIPVSVSRETLATCAWGMFVAVITASLASGLVARVFDSAGLARPVGSGAVFAAFGVALFGAFRLLLPSNILAFPTAVLLTAFYYAPPTGTLLDNHWSRMLVLVPISAAPFLWARRSMQSSTTPEQPQEYIPTLDGWRTIAVALVVLDHLAGSGAIPSAFYFFSGRGQHGVNLFFGISGFLITSKLLSEYRETRTISIAAFYRRRVYRILPAALLYLTIACVLFPRISSFEWASCLLFYRNLPQGMPPSAVTGHFWSLAVEEQFYLFFPVLLALMTPKRMRYVALLGALACGLWRWYYLPWDPAQIVDFRIIYRTDLRIDGLLWGCLLAFALSDENMKAIVSRATAGWKWWIALAGFVCVMAYYRMYPTIMESVLVAAILGGTVLHPQSIVGRLLESRPMKFFGRMSYSIYLWQHLFCFKGRLLLRPAWLGTFPYDVLITIAIASLSYYAVEKPILRWARRTQSHTGSRPVRTAHVDEPQPVEAFA